MKNNMKWQQYEEIEGAQDAVTTSKLRVDLFIMMMQIALVLISVFVIVYIFAPSYIRDYRLRSILKEHHASIDTSACSKSSQSHQEICNLNTQGEKK